MIDDDYAEMAASYEANPPRAEEISGPVMLAGRKSLSNDGRSPTVQARVSEAKRDRLLEIAADHGMTPSELLREALDDLIKRYEPTRTTVRLLGVLPEHRTKVWVDKDGWIWRYIYGFGWLGRNKGFSVARIDPNSKLGPYTAIEES